MHFFSKKLLALSNEVSEIKPTENVEILGILPTDFNAIDYRLIKRGGYFYALAQPLATTSQNTNVETKNYISKTKDFINWTGSKIGSRRTYYDEKSDAFFSVTLAETNTAAAYHITKINPDNFAYKTTTIMAATPLENTSRAITQLCRVGNYLMLFYYSGETNVYAYYSTDNGESWSTKKICSIASFSANITITMVSDGTKAFSRAHFAGTSTQVSRCFTSPTSFVASNCTACASDNARYTYGRNFYYRQTSKKCIFLTTDFINYSKTINIKTNSTHSSCYFYEDYLITTNNGGVKESDDHSYIGKINIFKISTGQMYSFDTNLNIVYKKTLGSTTYVYGNIQIIGFIDNFIYFIFTAGNNANYKLAKVPVDYVIENMVINTN